MGGFAPQIFPSFSRAPGAGQTSKMHPKNSGQTAFRYPGSFSLRTVCAMDVLSGPLAFSDSRIYSSAFARKPSKSGPGGPDSSPHDGYLVRVAFGPGSVLLKASGALLGGRSLHIHTHRAPAASSTIEPNPTPARSGVYWIHPRPSKQRGYPRVLPLRRSTTQNPPRPLTDGAMTEFPSFSSAMPSLPHCTAVIN